MNKSTKIVKKLLVLFLVVLMSIESFGAIVSDSDGSAFVTKQELEEVSDSLEAQKENILEGIDKKILGKISEYIAGINLTGDPLNFFPKLRAQIGANPKFYNKGFEVGSSVIAPSVVVTKSKNYSTRYGIDEAKKNFVAVRILGDYVKTFVVVDFDASGNVTGNSVALYCDSCLASEFRIYGATGDKIKYYHGNYSGGDVRSFNYETYSWGISADFLNALTSIKKTQFTEISVGSVLKYQASAWDSLNNGYMLLDAGTLRKKYGSLHRLNMKAQSLDNPTYSYGYEGSNEDRLTFGNTFTSKLQAWPNTVDNINMVYSSSSSTNNPLKYWFYRPTPTGTKSLVTFYNDAYLQQSLLLNWKSYVDHQDIGPSNMDNGKLNDGTVCTFTPNNSATYGLSQYGTNYTSYSDKTGGYLEQNISWLEATSDNQDYRVIQWGNGTNTDIYCLPGPPTLSLSGLLSHDLVDVSAQTGVTIGGKTHNISKVTNNVRGVTASMECFKLNTFENQFFSSVAGEKVLMGYGMPLFFTDSASSADNDYTLVFTMRLNDKSNVPKAEQLSLRLSKNHFIDGNFASNADIIFDGNVTSATDGVVRFELPISGLNAQQMVWLNLFGLNDNRIVELLDFEVNTK